MGKEIPPINSYKFRKDGWCLFRIPRCLLVFTDVEILKAIKRGKIWRRKGGEQLTAQRKGGEKKMKQRKFPFLEKRLSRIEWEKQQIEEMRKNINERKEQNEKPRK